MKIDCYCTLGTDREYDLDPSTLLHAMDQSGVEKAIIVPVDRCIAVDNRSGNDFVLQVAGGYPGRFIPACTANPWFGPAALAEIRRALRDGARMLVLHPFLQGYLADDELIWPLLALAADEEIPVYIHTGNPGNATPWQLVDLAERFPTLALIMGHGGSTDFRSDVNQAVQSVPNLYVETSLARPFTIPGLIESIGSSKIIMGSLAPIDDFTFEWEQMLRVVPFEHRDDVLGGNLRRLLEKRGPL